MHETSTKNQLNPGNLDVLSCSFQLIYVNLIILMFFPIIFALGRTFWPILNGGFRQRSHPLRTDKALRFQVWFLCRLSVSNLCTAMAWNRCSSWSNPSDSFRAMDRHVYNHVMYVYHHITSVKTWKLFCSNSWGLASCLDAGGWNSGVWSKTWGNMMELRHCPWL